MNDELTALDWIAVGMAAIGVLWVALLMPLVFVPRFAMLYRDFGGKLPALTLLVIMKWPQMVAAMLPASLLGAAVVGGRPLRTRRGLIVGAFFSAGVILAGSLLALYLPIFEIAGAIH